MKCAACGYIREADPDLHEDERYDSDKPDFYKSSLTVIFNGDQRPWAPGLILAQHVLICPKCGTLKIDFDATYQG
jgi:rubredoxin